MASCCQGHLYRARVRQLLPEPAEIDPGAAHAHASRPAPADRPWVLLNMVASIDGATAVDGVSGGLGGPADQAVFGAIRAAVDVILVAAGTARAESYGPPRTSESRQADRLARGQRAKPRMALVTRSLDLDATTSLFTEATEAPLIFTTDDAPPDRLHSFDGLAEVVSMGQHGVDLRRALSHLHAEGARTVLVEGGPSLNGQLTEAGLVDEVNLSLSPLLVGGDSARMVHSEQAAPLPMALAHLWEQDGLLFARYCRG